MPAIPQRPSTVDPALIDRTRQPILGITYDEQPVRRMTISGIEQSLPAKILSTNMRGAATRIVVAGPGWGTTLVGSFTADVEVFVLKGDLRVGSELLTDYEYAAIPARGVVGGLRTENGVIALLMTSGSIRYDTSTGGAPARLVIGRPGEEGWQRDIQGTDHYSLPVASTQLGAVWIGSTRQDPESPIWHTHPNAEETFVMEGHPSYKDLVDGEPQATVASPGFYFYRPAGSPHAAPTPTTDESVLTFNRSVAGHHESELLAHREGLASG